MVIIQFNHLFLFDQKLNIFVKAGFITELSLDEIDLLLCCDKVFQLVL